MVVVNRSLDKSDRLAIIDDEVKVSKRTEPVQFRNETKELPVVRLDIDLPIYRIKNGRTKVEQYQHVERNGLSPDFFENSEEDRSVQEAQEEILLRLSKDEKASIYNELRHVAVQTEALLLTSHGVVLNGNRRLAAMRDLFNSDPKTYEKFGHVNTIILPKETNESDLELLEAELQLAPKTRLEYGWIERRLKLRRQIEELKISRSTIKLTYRFKRDQEINVELQQLALAEEYLNDYLERPLAYQEVSQSEQLFTDLEKAIRGKKGSEEEARRHLGFLLARKAGNLGNRVYGYKSMFGSDFHSIVKKYSESQNIRLTSINPPNQELPTGLNSEDPLAGLPASSLPETNPDYSPITAKLKDKENLTETVDTLLEIFDGYKEERRQQTSSDAALKNAQKMNQIVQGIDLSTANPSTLPGIDAQLTAVIEQANLLKKEIDKLRSRAA